MYASVTTDIEKKIVDIILNTIPISNGNKYHALNDIKNSIKFAIKKAMLWCDNNTCILSLHLEIKYCALAYV